MKNFKEIKGDASFRRFFRKKIKNKSSIIVLCKKDKFKNLVVYDAINKILNKNKILAPNLHKENYHKNYIEIQDFGNNTIFEILNKKKKIDLFILKKLLRHLNKYNQLKIEKF